MTQHNRGVMQGGAAAACAIAARRPITVLWIAAALTLAAAAVAGLGLRVDPDMVAALGRDQPFYQDYARYTQQFPRYQQTLVVLFDAAAPEAAIRAQSKLLAALRAGPGWIEYVEDPDGGFFLRNGLLFLSPDELQKLTDQLAQAQPFLGRLSEDMSLRGFLGLLKLALEMSDRGVDFDLRPVLGKIDDAARSALAGRRDPMSWQRMIGASGPGGADPPPMLILKPRLDPDAIVPGLEPMRRLRIAIRETGIEPGVEVRITGPLALDTEQMLSGAKTAAIGAAVGLAMLIATLAAAMRSAGMVLGTLLGLLVTLTLSAAVAAAISPVGAGAMLFPLLVVPLAVGPGVGLATAYRTELARGLEKRAAIAAAGRRSAAWIVRLSLLSGIGAAAMTTAPHRGFYELGLIVAAGSLIGGGASVTILPAIWALLKAPAEGAFTTENAESAEGMRKRRRSKHALIRRCGLGGLRGEFFFRREAASGLAVNLRRVAVLGVTLLGAAAAAQVRFNGDPMRLRDPADGSVAGFEQLMKQSPLNPLGIAVMTPGEASAGRVAKRLREMNLDAEVVSLGDFVPEQQELKLSMIDGMSVVLGPAAARQHAPPDARQRRAAVEQFAAALRDYTRRDPAKKEAARLLGRLTLLEREKDGRLELLERNLLEYLPVTLGRLRAALGVHEAIGSDDLPPEVVAPWVSRSGVARVGVFPKDRSGDPARMERVVDAVRAEWPHATDGAALVVDTARLTRRSLVRSVIVAAAALAAMTVVMLRREALGAMAGAALAAALAGGVMGAAGIEVNLVSALAVTPTMGLMAGLSAAAAEGGAWSRRAAAVAGAAAAGTVAGLMLGGDRGLMGAGLVILLGGAMAGIAAGLQGFAAMRGVSGRGA